MLRWGILPYVVATFTSQLLLDLPITRDASAWYFGNMALLLAIVVGLATWAFYTSLAGRLWVGQGFPVSAPTSARP